MEDLTFSSISKIALIANSATLLSGTNSTISWLISNGYSVRIALLSNEIVLKSYMDENVRHVGVVALDKNSWNLALNGAQIVFHYISNKTLNEDYNSVMTETQHILDLCQAHKSVKKLVLLSESDDNIQKNRFSSAGLTTRVPSAIENQVLNFTNKKDCTFRLISLPSSALLDGNLFDLLSSSPLRTFTPQPTLPSHSIFQQPAVSTNLSSLFGRKDSKEVIPAARPSPPFRLGGRGAKQVSKAMELQQAKSSPPSANKLSSHTGTASGSGLHSGLGLNASANVNLPTVMSSFVMCYGSSPCFAKVVDSGSEQIDNGNSILIQPMRASQHNNRLLEPWAGQLWMIKRDKIRPVEMRQEIMGFRVHDSEEVRNFIKLLSSKGAGSFQYPIHKTEITRKLAHLYKNSHNNSNGNKSSKSNNAGNFGTNSNSNLFGCGGGSKNSGNSSMVGGFATYSDKFANPSEFDMISVESCSEQDDTTSLEMLMFPTLPEEDSNSRSGINSRRDMLETIPSILNPKEIRDGKEKVKNISNKSTTHNTLNYTFNTVNNSSVNSDSEVDFDTLPRHKTHNKTHYKNISNNIATSERLGAEEYSAYSSEIMSIMGGAADGSTQIRSIGSVCGGVAGHRVETGIPLTAAGSSSSDKESVLAAASALLDCANSSSSTVQSTDPVPATLSMSTATTTTASSNSTSYARVSTPIDEIVTTGILKNTTPAATAAKLSGTGCSSVKTVRFSHETPTRSPSMSNIMNNSNAWNSNNSTSSGENSCGGVGSRNISGDNYSSGNAAVDALFTPLDCDKVSCELYLESIKPALGGRLYKKRRYNNNFSDTSNNRNININTNNSNNVSNGQNISNYSGNSGPFNFDLVRESRGLVGRPANIAIPTATGVYNFDHIPDHMTDTAISSVSKQQSGGGPFSRLLNTSPHFYDRKVLSESNFSFGDGSIDTVVSDPADKSVAVESAGCAVSDADIVNILNKPSALSTTQTTTVSTATAVTATTITNSAATSDSAGESNKSMMQADKAQSASEIPPPPPVETPVLSKLYPHHHKTLNSTADEIISDSEHQQLQQPLSPRKPLIASPLTRTSTLFEGSLLAKVTAGAVSAASALDAVGGAGPSVPEVPTNSTTIEENSIVSSITGVELTIPHLESVEKSAVFTPALTIVAPATTITTAGVASAADDNVDDVATPTDSSQPNNEPGTPQSVRSFDSNYSFSMSKGDKNMDKNTGDEYENKNRTIPPLNNMNNKYSLKITKDSIAYNNRLYNSSNNSSSNNNIINNKSNNNINNSTNSNNNSNDIPIKKPSIPLDYWMLTTVDCSEWENECDIERKDSDEHINNTTKLVHSIKNTISSYQSDSNDGDDCCMEVDDTVERLISNNQHCTSSNNTRNSNNSSSNNSSSNNSSNNSINNSSSFFVSGYRNTVADIPMAPPVHRKSVCRINALNSTTPLPTAQQSFNHALYSLSDSPKVTSIDCISAMSDALINTPEHTPRASVHKKLSDLSDVSVESLARVSKTSNIKVDLRSTHFDSVVDATAPPSTTESTAMPSTALPSAAVPVDSNLKRKRSALGRPPLPPSFSNSKNSGNTGVPAKQADHNTLSVVTPDKQPSGQATGQQGPFGQPELQIEEITRSYQSSHVVRNVVPLPEKIVAVDTSLGEESSTKSASSTDEPVVAVVTPSDKGSNPDTITVDTAIACNISSDTSSHIAMSTSDCEYFSALTATGSSSSAQDTTLHPNKKQKVTKNDASVTTTKAKATKKSVTKRTAPVVDVPVSTGRSVRAASLKPAVSRDACFGSWPSRKQSAATGTWSIK